MDQLMKVTKIPFHGEAVSVITMNGERYVPVRPLIERIGLSWSRQRKKLTANPRWSVVALRATTEKDGKSYITHCLTPRKLRGFLYTIDARRVNPEFRPILEMYQEEIEEVIEQYSEQGFAFNPRMMPAQPFPVAPDLAQNQISVDAKVLVDLYESKIKLMNLEAERNKTIYENPKPDLYVNLKLADQILDKFLAGQTNGWIARQLGTNPNTVRHTVRYMVKKALGKINQESSR